MCKITMIYLKSRIKLVAAMIQMATTLCLVTMTSLVYRINVVTRKQGIAMQSFVTMIYLMSRIKVVARVQVGYPDAYIGNQGTGKQDANIGNQCTVTQNLCTL